MALISEYTKPGNGTTNCGSLLFLDSVYIYLAITRISEMHIFLFSSILQTLPSRFPLGSEAFNQYEKKPTCLFARLLAAECSKFLRNGILCGS